MRDYILRDSKFPGNTTKFSAAPTLRLSMWLWVSVVAKILIQIGIRWQRWMVTRTGNIRWFRFGKCSIFAHTAARAWPIRCNNSQWRFCVWHGFEECQSWRWIYARTWIDRSQCTVHGLCWQSRGKIVRDRRAILRTNWIDSNDVISAISQTIGHGLVCPVATRITCTVSTWVQFISLGFQRKRTISSIMVSNCWWINTNG